MNRKCNLARTCLRIADTICRNRFVPCAVFQMACSMAGIAVCLLFPTSLAEALLPPVIDVYGAQATWAAIDASSLIVFRYLVWVHALLLMLHVVYIRREAARDEVALFLAIFHAATACQMLLVWDPTWNGDLELEGVAVFGHVALVACSIMMYQGGVGRAQEIKLD